MAGNPDDFYLVRVTTDDRAHQLWVAAAASEEDALTLVLNAVPNGWTASMVSNKMTRTEVEVLNLKPRANSVSRNPSIKTKLGHC